MRPSKPLGRTMGLCHRRRIIERDYGAGKQERECTATLFEVDAPGGGTAQRVLGQSGGKRLLDARQIRNTVAINTVITRRQTTSLKPDVSCTLLYKGGKIHMYAYCIIQYYRSLTCTLPGWEDARFVLVVQPLLRSEPMVSSSQRAASSWRRCAEMARITQMDPRMHMQPRQAAAAHASTMRTIAMVAQSVCSNAKDSTPTADHAVDPALWEVSETDDVASAISNAKSNAAHENG
mmetsp:Transcript_37500/g.99167  ORF Transcript_37500/g.99167 Transcript_37500/m.99167 type:complete len:235 (-) Transcript_37500:372-1076(-)